MLIYKQNFQQTVELVKKKVELHEKRLLITF